jgi:hypothetical protein
MVPEVLMPTAATYPHIVKIEGSPAHLERMPRIRVAQIVMNYLDLGKSVDEICLHYPHLERAEVHSAMAYYFDHQAEIDAEIAGEQKMIEESYKNAMPTPFENRMRALGLLPPES